MTQKTLADFPISHLYKPNDEAVIQLYSIPTPNGVKVSIALEEMGIAYDAHFVPFSELSKQPYLSLNPNNKIPAIVDPDGPGGEAMGLFESGAILIYLAEKYGQLLPTDPARKYETIQWVMFQMGGIGPMFGQFGYFFKFAGKELDDKRPLHRYRDEAKRLLNVLEKHLTDRQWVMDDEYTIADIATFPWVRATKVFYEASDELGLDDYPIVMDWVDRCSARPASVKGLATPQRPQSA